MGGTWIKLAALSAVCFGAGIVAAFALLILSEFISFRPFFLKLSLIPFLAFRVSMSSLDAMKYQTAAGIARMPGANTRTSQISE